MSDPVADLTHSHAALNALATEIGTALRGAGGLSSPGDKEELFERLAVLREELLLHFAKEEEGLFPFMRAHVPARTDAVDRMERAHDAICGGIVRLSHLASHEPETFGERLPAALALYERFETAYTEHAREETAILAELDRTLDERQRRELAELVQGL